ncbi:MAG: 1-acyl-sn-glycerol-3-phosphate acyltransferase [Deltaproteobacteria bacterium]|nr:1-acyl-sn-glycerol-3-phosphate acyltransferase [Deltaproteobacteria bacterium]MBW2536082.1 1-acyl-sn-glycerol-3-phosphate acyltransferase [Deltaproteobacteria bacterium]
MPQPPIQPSAPEPVRDGVRDLLSLLYAPYNGLVVMPFFGASTLFWGVMAVLTSQISPRVGFHCGTVWAWSTCRVNFNRVRVHGRERADPRQSYVMMSNHQSHFDTLAFYGHWGRQFRWVIKEELRKVPGLGWGCDAVGHIFIDRSNRQAAMASLREAQRKLPPGVSIMIFPEGKRSPDGKLQPFKRGGFVMAQELGLPILPLTIRGTGRVLPKNSLRLLPGRIDIVVHDPIDPAAYGSDGRDQLVADVRAAIESGLA